MKTILKVGLAFVGVAILAADARAGRWLSRDPIQEGAGFVQREPAEEFDPVPIAAEPNLYAFVLNDPIDFVDPWGLITVGFYGADTWFTFPNEGNQKMMQIGKDVGAARMFHSLSHRRALHFLLSRLDTNGDGKYDECDEAEPIKIFGHSWGAISAAKLAGEIMSSPKFRKKDVAVLAVIDPVATLRLPPTSVPSNVVRFWNRYQTHGQRVVILGRAVHGRRLVCYAQSGCDDQIDLNPGPGDNRIDHWSIIDVVRSDLENLVK